MRAPHLLRTALLVALSVALLATPERALAQDGDVRILFIPSGSVPAQLRRTLTTLLDSRGTMLSYRDYAQEAGRRNMRPSARTTIRAIGPEMGATVVVVASYGGHYRRRVLRVRIYTGNGEAVANTAHTLRGQYLRAASQHQILNDLNQATGGRTSPAGSGDAVEEPEGGGDEGGGDEGGGDGGLPPPLDWEAEEAAAGGEGGGGEPPPEESGGGEGEGEGQNEEDLPLEQQSQWGFAVSAGGGIMHRSSSIPTMLGNATLSTLPFPAIQAEVLGSVRPDPSSRFRLELIARYTTSIGLVAQDERADGTTRTTDLRSHHFRIGLAGRIPLAPGPRPTVLLLEADYQLRMLDSEVMVSIPDYTLGGVVFRVGLFFTIGESPISIGIVPEIGHAQNLSEQLSQTAQVSDGFLVGGEIVVRVQFIRELALLLMYREAHAFLSSELDAQLTDAQRYGILRLEYRF